MTGHGSTFQTDLVAQADASGGLDEAAVRELCDEYGQTAHLAIMREPYLRFVLDGAKTIESRITKNRGAPYKRASSGDVILFKRSGGPIMGMATVDYVQYQSVDSLDELQRLTEPFSDDLCFEDDYLIGKADARYVSLLFLKEVQSVSPISYKKASRQAWVTMNPAGQIEIDLRNRG